ncbi:MAG: hypothetical protein HFI38_04540 [Lachnospiraceae bacterium]|nr:hypothetical protein [Lachnospiraceae bacterium]
MRNHYFKGEININNQQKDTILTLLKKDKMSGNYTNNYWFSYKDYLNQTDDFTDFCCERLEGKYEYVVLIENLISRDKAAKVFVQVYGLEDGDRVITADTLVIFSKSSLVDIKRIFNESKDIFPSDIGKETDFSTPAFLIGDDGELISSTRLFDDEQSVYYCWWD